MADGSGAPRDEARGRGSLSAESRHTIVSCRAHRRVNKRYGRTGRRLCTGSSANERGVRSARRRAWNRSTRSIRERHSGKEESFGRHEGRFGCTTLVRSPGSDAIAAPTATGLSTSTTLMTGSRPVAAAGRVRTRSTTAADPSGRGQPGVTRQAQVTEHGRSGPGVLSLRGHVTVESCW